MTGASKILTVSYGTFSCTLEGFDEPFNTMKAIAEYFRDLAADDRYFGAEPPTPDAAMLHRIAEREIHRRVEAKIQDNGVILRASDQLQTAALSTPEPTVTPAVTPAVVPAPDAQSVEADNGDISVAARLARIRAAAAMQATPVTPVAATAAPVAAVASVASETYVEDLEAISADFASAAFDAPDFDSMEDIDAAEIVTEAAGDNDGLAEEAAVAASTDNVGDKPQDATQAIHEQTADISDDHGVDDLTAADDQDLSGVADAGDLADLALGDGASPENLISATEAEDLLPEDYEDRNGSDAEASAESDVSAPFDDGNDDLILQNIEAAVSHPSVAEQATLDAPQPDAAISDSPAVLLDPLEGTDEAAFEQAADDGPGQQAAAEPAPEVVLILPALDDPEGDPEEEVASDDFDEEALFRALAAEPAPRTDPEPTTDEATPVPADAAPDPAPEAVANPAQHDSPVAALEKLQRARARVIRIRRVDPAPLRADPAQPDAAQPDDLQPVTAAEPAPDAAAIVVPRRPAGLRRPAQATDSPAAKAQVAVQSLPSALSAEAEAALQRELAALEADLAADPAPVIAPPEAQNRLAGDTDDAAVNRLIAQTNSEMDGPEVKRRLSAMAHLKAAVAATVAERRSTGGEATPAKPSLLERYRADLARVVRPLRGSTAAGERPSPLVLVSEQRIDRTIATVRPAEPVAPRRVSGGLAAEIMAEAEDDAEDDIDPGDDDNIFTDTRGFAEFADKLGAVSLPDLLEAAAAYAACIEGRPSFSRPQLMRQIASVTADGTLSREDGLRGFGTLLRQGRIEKLRRGQFALTDRSRFLIEGRRITG